MFNKIKTINEKIYNNSRQFKYKHGGLERTPAPGVHRERSVGEDE